jgi:hypothetical protein
MNGTIAAARMKPAYHPLVEAPGPLRPVLLGERLGDARAADEPFRAEPESGDEPRRCEFRDVLRQAGGQRPDRIQADRDPERLEPADSVGEQPDKERATPPGQEDRKERHPVAHDGPATRRLLWLSFLPAG